MAACAAVLNFAVSAGETAPVIVMPFSRIRSHPAGGRLRDEVRAGDGRHKRNNRRKHDAGWML